MPRALVYRAYTEPQLVQRWLLGPPGWSMPVCEMDVRVGGGFRWRWRNDQDASEFGFAGTFREVQSGSRLVHTEAYDPGTAGDDSPLLLLRLLLGLEPDTANGRLDTLPGAKPLDHAPLALQGVRALGRSWDVSSSSAGIGIEAA